jgi:glycogen operon protein
VNHERPARDRPDDADARRAKLPLGTPVVDGGVNFSLYSRTAPGVELLLFDREDDPRPGSDTGTRKLRRKRP